MGSRLAACIAGYRPKKRPTSAVMPMPSVTDHGSTVAGTGVKAAMVRAMPAPKIVPMTPPKTDSTIDSESICAMMSDRRAPSAFRRPISRVRSVTTISMMFMMTMPPTTSDSATTPTSTAKMPLVAE